MLTREEKEKRRREKVRTYGIDLSGKINPPNVPLPQQTRDVYHKIVLSMLNDDEFGPIFDITDHEQVREFLIDITKSLESYYSIGAYSVLLLAAKQWDQDLPKLSSYSGRSLTLTQEKISERMKYLKQQEIGPFLKKLTLYRETREKEGNSLFSFFFNENYQNKETKMRAAKKLIDYLEDKEENPKFTQDEMAALLDGRLEKITNELLKNHPAKVPSAIRKEITRRESVLLYPTPTIK